MSIDDIIGHVVALGGVLVLRPQPGDGSPEISWDDVFFYYAPTGEVPAGQPINPAERTAEKAQDLLEAAHHAARGRYQRHTMRERDE